MKNNLSIVLILAIFMSLVLGCGISDRIQKAVEGDSKSTKSGDSTSKGGDDKSVTDKAIDAVADGESSGVAECDEVIAIIDQQLESKDDNWMSKAAKGYIFGQFKKSIKESIEKEKGDKTKLAEQCNDIKKNVVKALEEEKSKAKE
jgi:hypothetical protein